MVAAPQLGNGAWELSKIFMDKMSYLLKKLNRKRQQLSAKITCQLAITEYGKNKFDVESCQDLKSENKMNLNFTLKLEDSDLPLNRSPVRKFKTKEILQRKPSFTVNRTDTLDNDTFDHILHVTSQHDTIMAFYYLDENNKVKVTEIFDVTDSDSPIVQTSQERNANKNLEYDDDWPDHTENEWNLDAMDDGGSQYDIDADIMDGEPIFSDPESEWTEPFTVEEIEDELLTTSDHRPESERNAENNEQWKEFKVPSMVYEAADM